MNRAVRVFRSAIIDAPVEPVWRLVRDFNSHASWHPAIAASRIEADEPADSVGAVRAFQLGDGSILREQLIALSDRERQLTYCLLEAPLPLMDYVATMRLRSVTDGERTFVTWESRFRPPEERAEELSRMVAGDIYEAGFQALKRRFETTTEGGLRKPLPLVGRGWGGVSPPRSAVDAPHPDPLPTRSRVLPTSASRTGNPETSGLRGRGARGEAIHARAIVVPRYGGPEVMAEQVLSVPPPGPGEVRLRHTAIGVNFIDVYCRTGYFSLLTPPGVPGMEGAGILIDSGEGVAHLQAGQRVVYACAPVGAYAEARTMPATLVVPLPDDIDDETAAAIFLKGLSAEFLLHRVHEVQPGETVLVHAAAGGMGLLLSQWASGLGATVIGTVSTDNKAEHAMRAGCAQVIVHTRENFVDAVGRLTGGRGADVVYDGVGQATFGGSVETLAERGHVISFGQASGPVRSWDIDALASKSATISRPNFGHYTSDPVQLGEMAARLFEALRRGIIRATIDVTLPLAQAAEAHRRLERRANIGAIVLVP